MRGLKLLLPRRCGSYDLCGLPCSLWRVKRPRRAQQWSAIWRVTMPLSGPCLNGKLDCKTYRQLVRVLLFGGIVSLRASERLDCRSEHGGCPGRRGNRRAAHCISLMGQSLPTRVGTLSLQEPVSLNPALIYVRSLPTPARFRPPGPPMFGSPTTAS